jgi:putative NADPH-quinone reductase
VRGPATPSSTSTWASIRPRTWTAAGSTRPSRRRPRASRGWPQALAESDRLVDQLDAADLVVIGLPMYNFSVPAQFKAWIDNIVRVGRTFGFDRARGAVPYWPLLAGMRASAWCCWARAATTATTRAGAWRT